MTREPSQADAELYLRLLAITQTGFQAEARTWFLSEFEASSLAEMNARYPRGTRDRDYLTNVLGFYEAAGVLVSRGLLHEDVFFDAPFAFEIVWERMGRLLEEWRQDAGDPAVWENVVWLGSRYAEWRKTAWEPKAP